MTYEKYKELKKKFEERYAPYSEEIFAPLQDLVLGFYNKNLFFFLYSYDSRPGCNSVNHAVETYRRFRYYDGRSVSRITRLGTTNLFQFEGEFEKMKNFYKAQLASGFTLINLIS